MRQGDIEQDLNTVLHVSWCAGNCLACAPTPGGVGGVGLGRATQMMVSGAATRLLISSWRYHNFCIALPCRLVRNDSFRCRNLSA